MADSSRRAFLRRAARGAIDRARSARERVGRAVDDARNARTALQAMRDPAHALATLGERAGDAIDLLASRMLARDAAAAQLAFLVERAVNERGREAVLRIVLRRNLLLDGTFLQMLEPLLAGGDAPALPRPVLDRGRQTLTTLLVEVVDPDAAPVEATREDLERFANAHPDAPLQDLVPALSGELDDEDLAGFVFGSYALFLQTFLLRSTVRMMPELVSSPALDDSSTEDA